MLKSEIQAKEKEIEELKSFVESKSQEIEKLQEENLLIHEELDAKNEKIDKMINEIPQGNPEEL